MAKVSRVARALVAAACLVGLTAGCGGDTTVAGGPPAGPGDGVPSSAPPGGPVSTAPSAAPSATPTATGSARDSAGARVAYFSTALRGPEGLHEVLRDRDGLQRFAEKAAGGDQAVAREISASGAATDFSRMVLVGWTRTTGCGRATSASLVVTGDRMELRVGREEGPAECFAPYQVTVVFEVAKERVPARPVFA